MDSSAETDPRVRVRQQEVVAELGQRALEIDDLDQLMEEAADAVAETLDTGQCSVLELLPGGDSARLRQAAGVSEEHVGTATVPVGPDTLAGRVLRSADPVVVADVDDEERFAVPDLLTDAGAVSVVAAVVGSTDDPWGVVCAHASEGRAFTEADVNFVRNVANVLASAVANERARSELEEVYGRVSDAVFALDEAWNFTYLNERAHELINPDDRELVGENIWEAFPEAVTRSFREQYERAMYEQEAVSFEEYYPEPLDAWFEVQAYPSETGLSVYFRDVSERKERERELAERERRLSTLIDNVPGMVYRCRNERGWPMAFVSDACADVTGYEAEALESGTVSWGEDVVLESEREALWDAVQEAVRETGTFSETYRVETADGEVRWVRDFGRGVVEDGEVVEIEGIITDVTERMRTEHELEEKERRYEAVFEDPNILVGLLEPDGTVLDINQTAMEYVDADLEDVTGEPFWETPWWGEGDGVQDDVREWTERAADGEYVDFEADLTRPDGEGYTLSGYFRPVTDDDGEVVSIIVSDRDVTERKERERELEESEQRYRTLAEHFPNGVVALVDRDLRYRTLGGDPMPTANATVEDVEGRLVAEILPDPVAAALVPRYEAALEGESSEFELEFDGRAFQFHVVPVRDDDGEVFAALGTSRDVTERTERERELARYETIVETVNDGIYVKDSEGRFTMVNDAYAELTGYDREELVGEHASMVVDEAAIQESRELVDRSAGEDDDSPAMETLLQTADDESVPAEGTFSTLRTPDGDELEVGVVRDITERLEAQRELRESEAKFRMLAENLEEVVWMADADAEEFVYINPAFEDVWGVDRDALYDDMLAFLDDVHPEDRERVRENFTALPAEEFDDEFRILRDDGEVRWVRARGARVRDEDAEMVRVVGIGEDVTARKRRERQLEESERRYRTLAENFPNGAVGVYDRDLRYTLAAGEMIGDPLPDAEVVEGTKMTEMYPDDVVDDLEPMFRAAVEDGEAGSARTTVFGRHWQAWVTPLRNADGEIFAGLSFNQDVTEQVEREAELERALALLERAERIADVGGWELDPETTEVFWTDQVFDLLEVPGDEEPPMDEALAMYHEEDQSILEDAIEEAIETGDPFDVEVRVRTAASDEVRWLRLQGVPETEDGEVVSLRGAAQDVTERKERERRLEESNERLEQFAYAASHDLQEPLRMVSSYLQLVDQRYAEALDDDGREFIEYAVDGADRMREMIEALLEYSRVETEGNPLEPIELDAVVEDVLADLQLQIEETDATVAVDSLPCVEGDASQLRQLFQNLLENALTYTGDEPPRIDVSAERVGARWRLSVSDEGVGIDPGEQDAIFQVFQRLHSREEHPGTGIGLALCRRIVERHGGEIWVDSEPGEGATFTFTLPAAGDGDE